MSLGGLLGEMAASSARRAREAAARESLAALVARARRMPAAPALNPTAFDVIAEVKLRAPSAGALAAPDDPVSAAADRARAYAEAGAMAVSVLTEPDRFDGDLTHLAAAAAACAVPVMRKDFLVDPYQVWEARAAGAGGVLLIARMLDDEALPALVAASEDAGLFLLLEAFDALDLARAAGVAARWRGPAPLLVGLNCRDLDTLAVDRGRLLDLASRFPPGVITVAESGIEGPADVVPLVRAGYRAALVGTSLMRAADPAQAVRGLLAAGRGA